MKNKIKKLEIKITLDGIKYQKNKIQTLLNWRDHIINSGGYSFTNHVDEKIDKARKALSELEAHYLNQVDSLDFNYGWFDRSRDNFIETFKNFI